MRQALAALAALALAVPAPIVHAQFDPQPAPTAIVGWTTGAAQWVGNDAVRARARADYCGGLIRDGQLDGYCRA